MVEVGEDVSPVPAQLPGQGFHGFRPRMHHPRAQGLETRPGLDPVGAVGVDVLQGLAHPAGPGGPGPPPLQAAFGLQLQFRQVRR